MRIAQLLYAMFPAYLANMAPPFVRYWHGWNRPISVRWLGSHKTVLGATIGVLTGLLVAFAQSRLAWQGSLLPPTRWPLTGALLGLGAIGGDALKSLLKRRIGIAPGARWIPADQLDFVAGALMLIAPLAGFAWSDVTLVLILSFIGDVVVNHVAYGLHIRDAPW